MKKILIIFLLLIMYNTSALEGDANNDHVVDLLDLILVAQNFGKTSGFDSRADLNNDGSVGLLDLIVVAQNYGKTQQIVCSDGNCDSGEDCNNCPVDCGQCPDLCGNGALDSGEQCDDANPNAGDGCSNCNIESGWLCSDAPSICTQDIQGTAKKWFRHVIEFPNPSYSGNPFELDMDVTFIHTSDTIKLPAYYDGNNIWKVGFMPTQTGQWTYTTSSSDSDLNAKTGSIDVDESSLPGILKADPSNPRKWKFSDGPYLVPIVLRMEFFSEPGDLNKFKTVANFLQNNNLHMLETRLLEEYGQFGGRHDYIFEGSWQNHNFDLEIWNRFEERMDELAKRGLGAHIMLYSDDAGVPGWSGKSNTERLVIKYLVARTAGYPVVLYNTGIDIAEYRNQDGINWIGARFKEFDPYDHPVSSRAGGGSGSYAMSGQTFKSQGDQTAKVNDVINYFQNSNIPVSMDDAWGENRPSHPSKNFRPEDIRRAFWKTTIAGGVGGLIRSDGGGCGQNGAFHFDCLANDLESEQWLKLINPFIQKLGNTFGLMTPDYSLVQNGYALTDSSKTKILYFLMGKNDKWDSGNGGAITIKLSSVSGSYNAVWFDTRTGSETSAGTLSGGQDYSLIPPSSDDWILLLQK